MILLKRMLLFVIIFTIFLMVGCSNSNDDSNTDMELSKSERTTANDTSIRTDLYNINLSSSTSNPSPVERTDDRGFSWTVDAYAAEASSVAFNSSSNSNLVGIWLAENGISDLNGIPILVFYDDGTYSTITSNYANNIDWTYSTLNNVLRLGGLLCEYEIKNNQLSITIISSRGGSTSRYNKSNSIPEEYKKPIKNEQVVAMTTPAATVAATTQATTVVATTTAAQTYVAPATSNIGR